MAKPTNHRVTTSQVHAPSHPVDWYMHVFPVVYRAAWPATRIHGVATVMVGDLRTGFLGGAHVLLLCRFSAEESGMERNELGRTWMHVRLHLHHYRTALTMREHGHRERRAERPRAWYQQATG